jgi:hypothetical protein
MIKKATIYVDIDGTLTNETFGYGNDIYAERTPRQDIIDRVNDLFDKGHTIILWTARHKCDRSVTKKWLKKYKVKYNNLILGKPKYTLFVCDRATTPEDFKNLVWPFELEDD